MELLEPADQEEENSNVPWTALVKTNRARDECDAQPVVESHQLLTSQNYKVMMPLGERKMLTLMLAISDKGVGPNFVKRSFASTACLLLIKLLEAARLRSAGHTPLKEVGMVATDVQTGQLRRKSRGFGLPRIGSQRYHKKCIRWKIN